MADENVSGKTIPAAPFEMVINKIKKFKTEFIACDGRARRGEYWVTALLFALPQMILTFFCSMIAIASGSVAMAVIMMLITGVFGLLMLPVTIRRWHDFGVTGWVAIGVMFGACIPYVGGLISIAAFVFMCIPGTKGPNAFGANPLDPNAAAVEGKKEPAIPFYCAGLGCVILNVIIVAIQINAVLNALRAVSDCCRYF